MLVEGVVGSGGRRTRESQNNAASSSSGLASDRRMGREFAKRERVSGDGERQHHRRCRQRREMSTMSVPSSDYGGDSFWGWHDSWLFSSL